MSNENNQQNLFPFAITDLYTACGIIEEFVEIPDGVDSYTAKVQAWQYLINSGHAWTLQGWYGRNAHALIQNGVCQPPQRK